MRRTNKIRFKPLTKNGRLRIGLALMWLFVWLLLSITGSCTQTEVEENDIPPHALKEVEAGFNLHVLASQTPATRSATEDKDTVRTRAEKALGDAEESKIAHLWIGQYDAATGNRLFSQYIETMADDNKVNVKLKQSNDGSSKSNIWFVANSGNPEETGEMATEKTLKEHVLTYSFTEEGLPQSGLCGMTGMWSGVVKGGGMKDLTVDLTRLVAKITFTYAIGGSGFSFTPASVTLNSVPDRSQIVAPEAQLQGVAYKTYKGTASGGGSAIYWYLPENMAGTVSGNDAVESVKKKTGKGVSNATYIELTGDAVQDGVTYKDVAFRFYPGSDENNYDIMRNSHYTIDVTLVGIDVSDERITVGGIPPITVSPDHMPAEKGGEKEVQVTARPGQEWCFDMPRWLSAIIGGKYVAPGATLTYQGPYLVTFQAAEANPKVEERSVEFPIDINGTAQKITITQSGSTMEVGPDISLTATGGATGSSTFTATKGLLWDAVLSGQWLSWATVSPATPGAEATGSSQSLQVKSLAPNPSATVRSGKITVKAGASAADAGYAGLKKEINVTQAGSTVTGSTKTVNAEAANSLTSSFTVTPGLSWVASVTNGNWITLATTAGGPATGSAGSVIYDVAINPNEASRTGNITVRAGDASSGPTGVITINQNGSLFSATAPTATIPADGSATVTGSVTATTGLAWTISPETSNNITVSPISGKGDATLTFTGTDNDGAERTGAFSVSVTEASPARTATIMTKQATKEIPALVRNIQVCKTDEGIMNWNSAYARCSNSTKEGYSDWRLPEESELYIIRENRRSLEAMSGFAKFYDVYTWSKTYTQLYEGGYRVVNLYLGNGSYYTIDRLYNVRCVRDI